MFVVDIMVTTLNELDMVNKMNLHILRQKRCKTYIHFHERTDNPQYTVAKW